MTSRERLTAVLSGRTPDRVPVSTYDLVALNYWPKDERQHAAVYDALGFDFKNWHSRQNSYKNLLSFLAENTDCMYLWFPEETGGFGKILTGRAVRQNTETWTSGDSLFTRISVETPKGLLSMQTRVDRNVNTIWETEHLLKDLSDVERLLAIPYEPYRPDISSYAVIDARLGENGIMMPNIGDPLLYVAELFGFTDFIVYAYTDRVVVKKLLDEFFVRVMDYLEYMLGSGVRGMYRIFGPEYATPPYLPKDMFDDFVTPYVRRMVETIHRHGAFARIHAHGRVNALLEDFRDMGADALDPLEAPPSGDTDFADAKRRIGGDLCLMGNMQLNDLELLDEGEVREKTLALIEAGKPGGRFVAMPTAGPINEPIGERTERNIHAFVDTLRSCGNY
jgi:uroporphyrinogen-III decarboxylase